MTTGVKTGLFLSGLALVAMGTYYGHLNWGWFKKAEEKADPATPAAPTTKPAAVKSGSGASTQPVKPNTTAPLPPPSPIKQIGDSMFAGQSGANAYKTATASQTNIYKFYQPSKYVGTYLSESNGFTKVIVLENGLFGTSNKEVYVPSKDINK